MSTVSASLIHQHSKGEWTWKERGGEGLETTAPSLFLEHLSMPCPTHWETCKEKNHLCRVPRCPVNAAALCPEKKIKCPNWEVNCEFGCQILAQPSLKYVLQHSEKCAISSGGRLGCSKSLKAIESNFNKLTSQCSRKFSSQVQAYRNTCSLIVN